VLQTVSPAITYCLVTYTIIAGESNITKKLVVDVENESVEEAIHAYFSEYWGKDFTITDIKGRSYHRDDDEEAIKINHLEMIPDTDAYVLKKYL
jgi:hypothetical protein